MLGESNKFDKSDKSGNSCKINWNELISLMEHIALNRNAPVFKLKSFLKTPFQHLIFTVLSSRTRDEKTIEACKRLFSYADTPEKIASMDVEKIEELIKGVGFYRVKAKNIKEIARIVSKRGMPETYEDLIKLPGVGRKTANVVLASAFGKPTIGVDTHVHRISNRLGIVSTEKPEETELMLKKIVPENYWIRVNRAMVGFGQTICKPLKPDCANCPFKWCPSRRE